MPLVARKVVADEGQHAKADNQGRGKRARPQCVHQHDRQQRQRAGGDQRVFVVPHEAGLEGDEQGEQHAEHQQRRTDARPAHPAAPQQDQKQGGAAAISRDVAHWPIQRQAFGVAGDHHRHARQVAGQVGEALAGPQPEPDEGGGIQRQQDGSQPVSAVDGQGQQGQCDHRHRLGAERALDEAEQRAAAGQQKQGSDPEPPGRAVLRHRDAHRQHQHGQAQEQRVVLPDRRHQHRREQDHPAPAAGGEGPQPAGQRQRDDGTPRQHHAVRRRGGTARRTPSPTAPG